MRSIYLSIFAHICFCLFFTSPAKAEAELEKQAAYAASAEWHRALFYAGNGSSAKSVIGNAEFFAAGLSGRTDPALELAAELALFRGSTENHEDPVRCRFTFRYERLKKHFDLPELPPCAPYEHWRSFFQSDSLSVVFASQYVSNPSSIFGHTFLVATSQQRLKAFWQTFNYAALMPEDVNPFAYALGGIFGWYRGDFGMMPYYERIYQYADIENRNLWLYPARLTQEQTEEAFELLWELSHQARFVYYFFDENCAGEILRFFMALFPDFREGQGLPGQLEPSEAVKILNRAGLLAEPSVNPSQYDELRAKYSALDANEKQLFASAVKSPASADIESCRLAEALMEETAYQTHEHNGKLPESLDDLERKAYIARAKCRAAPMEAPALTKELRTAPHLAHDPMTFDFGGAAVNGHAAFDLGWRGGVHGPLDPEAGFLPNAQFEAFKIAFSANAKQVWLKDFTLFSVENFQDFWRFEPKFSWRASLSGGEDLLADSPSQTMTTLSAGGGLAFSLDDQAHHWINVFLAGAVNVGADLPQGPFDLGPELGYRYHNDGWSALATFRSGTGLFEGGNQFFLSSHMGLAKLISRHFELIGEAQQISVLNARQGTRVSAGVRLYE